VLDAADLEAGLLELRSDERERQARICPGEDVPGHEHRPGEVRGIPVTAAVVAHETEFGRTAQPDDLEEEQAVLIEQAAHLPQELLEVLHADVLRHLQAGDLVVSGARHVPIIEREDARAVLPTSRIFRSCAASNDSSTEPNLAEV